MSADMVASAAFRALVFAEVLIEEERIVCVGVMLTVRADRTRQAEMFAHHTRSLASSSGLRSFALWKSASAFA